MARFDVYAFSGGVKFVVDVQADLLAHLGTRIVVPLRLTPKNRASLISRLNPVFQLDGIDYYLSATELAAVPTALLKAKKTSLENHRHKVIDALDFLMQGF